ncbi:MAG: Gfo/Idh/MocA family oxidoreductase [Caldilineaceae bacterium SB0670_bin_27]|uniref:Gfo/Idh/MocA family oxidoreductase n=1 Tax=Caldilineaceae bacterium SB0664_bin_27 TaxID=2605260 RepID=A0A6B0YU21_9CHLR|nr:Gfo/Idh/MocA family oxidoreductase [Caldilineaceae bacterium SB0664_bin_27]MYJ76825.1 Gfo/Idh/MocA family oxidoreductase [Caldilineaceae bacterium SB0670_bin_27]
MTQNELGFAILGAGMVAEYHLNAIQECADLGARLVGVGHYNPARYGEISQRFGVPARSYDDVLADPAVDAVCICTPSGQHAQETIAAASNGKHVLVEKPMALSLADADAMIAACRENGVQLGVCLQRRAEPLFRRVHDAIHGGDLGEITLGVVTMPYYRDEPYYAQADWRGTWEMDGGGVLMNQGIHIIDLLLWFLGDPVDVHAFADSRHRSVEIEDTAGAVLRFANGAVATITATVATEPGFPHRLEVYGTNGGIQIEGESVLRWGLADEAKSTVEPWPVATEQVDAGMAGDPRGISTSGHIAILKDFISGIRRGEDPVIDGTEGRRSLAAILAVYEDSF